MRKTTFSLSMLAAVVACGPEFQAGSSLEDFERQAHPTFLLSPGEARDPYLFTMVLDPTDLSGTTCALLTQNLVVELNGVQAKRMVPEQPSVNCLEFRPTFQARLPGPAATWTVTLRDGATVRTFVYPGDAATYALVEKSADVSAWFFDMTVEMVPPLPDTNLGAPYISGVLKLHAGQSAQGISQLEQLSRSTFRVSGFFGGWQPTKPPAGSAMTISYFDYVKLPAEACDAHYTCEGVERWVTYSGPLSFKSPG